ncbi:hypothetical protein BC828DRAFT_88331 [Blastocladiella britannica]|nr:hypothetical protein BC828DRAFT_88331 [Blastocladiella britannica]
MRERPGALDKCNVLGLGKLADLAQVLRGCGHFGCERAVRQVRELGSVDLDRGGDGGAQCRGRTGACRVRSVQVGLGSRDQCESASRPQRRLAHAVDGARGHRNPCPPDHLGGRPHRRCPSAADPHGEGHQRHRQRHARQRDHPVRLPDRLAVHSTAVGRRHCADQRQVEQERWERQWQVQEQRALGRRVLAGLGSRGHQAQRHHRRTVPFQLHTSGRNCWDGRVLGE